MASEKEIHELIGKAVVDAEFRQRMIADPAQAAQELGYSLTSEQAEQFRAAEGPGLAELLEERLPKSLGIPSPA